MQDIYKINMNNMYMHICICVCMINSDDDEGKASPPLQLPLLPPGLHQVGAQQLLQNLLQGLLQVGTDQPLN